MSDGFKPKPKVLHQGQGGVAALPAAGHARKEVLKQRTDQLAEAGAALPEGGTLDLSRVEPEREIVGHFDSLRILNPVPGKRYCWLNFKEDNGLQIERKLASEPWWEVVRGDMPECPGRKMPDGTRVIGDVMLLRCPEEMAVRHDGFEKRKRDAVQSGVTSNLKSLGDRYRSKGVVVHTPEDMSDNMRRAIEHPSQSAVNAHRGSLAASELLDKNLRNGTVKV